MSIKKGGAESEAQAKYESGTASALAGGLGSSHPSCTILEKSLTNLASVFLTCDMSTMLYFPGPEREVRQMKMHRKHFVQRLAQNKGSAEAHPIVLCSVCHTLSTREPFLLTLLHFSREHALPAPSLCFQASLSAGAAGKAPLTHLTKG